ncbi:MAG: hypothetical protein JSW28_02085 [Thermoplasmata archaeon]|nr:MAG: hypothetical protein JSW28_02085 [Thermoplasmata archaeon]
MAKTIIEDYRRAGSLEESNPAEALSIYKEKCMQVSPRTQKSYKWSRFFKTFFIFGFIVGIFTNGIQAAQPETPMINKILYLTIGPIVAGIGFCLVFGTVYALVIGDKTKSPKYWYSLLGYIGAARLSLKIDQAEEARKYAMEIHKFEVGTASHVANGILALADRKYRQAEYALQLASSIPPEGKFGSLLFDTIYKTGELLPQEMRVRRPPSPEQMRSDYERRMELARQGIVADTLHVQEYVGGDKVEIKDSVVSKSNIKTSEKRKGS